MLPTQLCGIFLKDSTIFKIVFTAVIQFDHLSVDTPIKVKSLAIKGKANWRILTIVAIMEAASNYYNFDLDECLMK